MRAARLLACSLCAFAALAATAPGSGAQAPPTVKALVAGGFSGYALMSDGSVSAWGDDFEGQLGTAGDGVLSVTPIGVAGIGGIVAIAGGANSAFALTASGSVLAWGDDVQDELGDDGAQAYSDLPHTVPVPSDVIAVAAGGWNGYALSADGSVWAWGDDDFGQLGRQGLARGRPLRVRGLPPVKAIAAGEADGYALSANGTVWAWGDGSLGELGDGRRAGRTRPVAVLDGVQAIAAGAYTAYALRDDGSVWAWGEGGFGALGAARRSTDRPLRVRGLSGVVAIAAGGESAYALMGDGSVRAWGRGVNGELGDGRAANSATPQLVAGLSDVVALAGGGVAAYALDSQGRVWAWGSNVYGQLGDGTRRRSEVPTLSLAASA